MKDLDGIIVSSLVNIRYYSGFTGSSGLLWVDRKAARLWTDRRYGEQAAAEAGPNGVRLKVVKGQVGPSLEKEIEGKKLRLGYEDSRVSHGFWQMLSKHAQLTGLEGAIETARMKKDAGEIEKIRASVDLNARVMSEAVKKFRVGTTESELAAYIDYRQRLRGADGTAFETIVAGGAHAALPHARPRQVKIEAGGYLLIDMGAAKDGYMSDLTRTYGVGKMPRKAKEIYRAVAEAQRASIEAVKPGVKAEEVHAAGFKVLKKAKLAKYFLHSTGHGLGLEIHEAPRLGTGDATVLEENMTITIEPGAYLEGFGGVRIEDTVLVTKEGAEVLTPLTVAPKEWTIVG